MDAKNENAKRSLVDVKAGDTLIYRGKSWSFWGDYLVVREAETFTDPERAALAGDALVIVEFTNDGTPMFFRVDQLNEADWEIAE